MKRRQDEGDLVSAKMKRGQHNSDEVSPRMKRKQDNGEGLNEGADLREYRTAKRKKGVTKQDPESSPSTSSCSDKSETNSRSSWDSWDSDNESPNELPEEEPQDSSIAHATQQVSGKMKREEAAVLGDLGHFWSSKVAAKARKELGKLSKTQLGKNIGSLEKMNTRCRDVKKLMELPCVVSVGFSKDSKFTVFVSDRNKALELSEELENPNIKLVEARNSHLT